MTLRLPLTQSVATAVLMTATLFAAPAALAQSQAASSLTLVAGKAPVDKLILDSAVWTCVEGTCTATGGKSLPALRVCKRVVAKLGAVSSFRWQGQDLSAEAVATCNTAAQ